MVFSTSNSRHTLAFVPPERQYVPHPEPAGRFDSTHWSVVLTAAQTHAPDADKALAELCHSYWPPLYCYLRRKGFGTHQAEDLTQQFFAERVVTKRVFKGMHPARGKFRSWLLCSLDNLVKNAWDKERAQKRGGALPHLPFDLEAAELRCAQDPQASPERLYDRAWAAALLERAMNRMRQKYTALDKLTAFDELKGCLPGFVNPPDRSGLAKRLKMDEKTLNVAISRFRQEFARFVRAEVRRTVGGPDEVEEELRYLLAVLSE